MAETAPSNKRPIAITAGAAVATIVVVLAILAGPTALNCLSSPDGLGACFQNRLSEMGVMPKPATAVAAQGGAEAPIAQPTAMAATPAPAAAPAATPEAEAKPEPDQRVAATKPVEPSPPAGANSSLPAPSTTATAPAAVPAPVTETARPAEPTITLLRAEPDGSLVVAGTGAPESELALYANDDALGQTGVEKSGDWVFVPDAPLAPGDYEITLGPVGSDTRYGASMVVAIADDKTSEPLVVASTPGEASKVLQGLRQDQPAARATAPEATPAPAQAAEAIAPPAKPAEETARVASTQKAAAPAAVPTPAIDPTIDAIEIDGDKNFFAGSGAEGATVRLYIDDSFIADSIVEGGRWLIETANVLTKASQRIRVDMLAKDSADVAARAEVDFAVDLPETAVADTQTAADKPATETAQAPAPSETQVPTMVATQQGDAESDRFASGKAIIRRGDNLWTIARRVYGQGVRYTTIYEANNSQIRNPDRIYPGQIFELPKAE